MSALIARLALLLLLLSATPAGAGQVFMNTVSDGWNVPCDGHWHSAEFGLSNLYIFGATLVIDTTSSPVDAAIFGFDDNGLNLITEGHFTLAAGEHGRRFTVTSNLPAGASVGIHGIVYIGGVCEPGTALRLYGTAYWHTRP